MTLDRTRLAGWALVIGGLVATAGYLAAGTLVHGHGNAQYTSALWTPLNGIAVGGDIITALGLPAILACHGRLAPRLTLIGYVGIFATIVMLNISEGCVEAFIKPYLATHGGVPSNAPAGLAVFEDVALVCLVVGLVCLGIAVIRARVFPRWTGVLFIVSALTGFLPLPGPFALLSDYLAFIALITIGLQALRTESPHPEPASPLTHRAPATP